ncbi:mechanosensitive ion channel protein MscS [miscellaneous Crenarchaeota group archaeon SMTZ-80]|nr:MAG: mechanosensitive ion channel protein MscS [miscellaneous Crenarchaeota group archaeon SMTZ-80]
MFLEQQFYHNSVKEWLIALVIVVLSFFVLKIIFTLIRRKIKKLAKKTKTDLDDLVADLLERIKFFFILIIALYFGSLILTLPQTVNKLITSIVIIVLLLQGAIWGNGIITYFIERYKKKRIQEDAAGVTTFSALGFVARIVLWSLILLVILDNLGVNITTLVAGLGIGGIAIALAVQNILSDLFASLSIVLDKPFVLGDFIIVDNHLGSVEHIGLKTTRIRSLSGEQLVFSNTDLLNSRIRNFKRMAERRVVFSIGVVYQTPEDKLKLIPQMIKEIIESQELTRFDRAHFKEFGNFSLNFEVVYWMASPDYNLYMDTQQRINLQIFHKFNEENIEFAYPSQTIFMEKSE